MTSFVLVSESSKPQTLDEGETGFIGQGALLTVAVPGAPEEPAIRLNSGAANVTVLGTVFAHIAVSGANAEDAQIVVGDQGAVTGIGTAISLAASAEILNDGLIASQTDRALALHDGDNHIVNTGTIAAPITIRPGTSVGFDTINRVENALTGVIAASGMALRVKPGLATTELVINDGAIYGDLNLGAMSDIVTNRGTISGVVHLGAGSDVYHGGGVVDGMVRGGGGMDLLKGGANEDALNGGNGRDTLRGYEGDDILTGARGRDSLIAGDGDDILIGGSGRDVMRGGAGNDRFFFKSLNDFGNHGHGRDLITDFVPGEDVIDLSAIDPPTQIPTAFTFIGTQDFSGHPFELRCETKGSKTVVSGDLDGDAIHDFQVQLTGQVNLAATDFVL